MTFTNPNPGKFTKADVERLKARKAEGIGNRQLAAEFGCSPGTVSMYLSGKREGSDSEAPPAPTTSNDVAAYREFVARKLALNVPTGIVGAEVSSPYLFPHQAALTQWALRLGRAAIFAAMGLGKSRMALFWAAVVSEYTGKPVLILTPLAVAKQFKREGEVVGIDVTIVRERGDVRPGVNVMNYERLDRLDTSAFGGVVTDESSVVKGMGSKTLEQLCTAFADTPFVLAATATPSPNSFMELGQHCELLRICSRSEMLAEYFVHDGGNTANWELKGHARSQFWRFVSSWGALVRSPADLGFDGSAYVLPALHRHVHTIPVDEETVRASGKLFADPARSLMERRRARRASLAARVAHCTDLANSDDEPWIIFCDFNDESEALSKSVRGAVELTGSMEPEEKERALESFLDGTSRVLVSKASLAGHGLNLQHCNRVCFAGVSDSWEQQFQAIGRVHRFGQKREVQVHYVLGELESESLKNIQRKQVEADQMADELAAETRDIVRMNVNGQTRAVNPYEPRQRADVPAWLEASP